MVEWALATTALGFNLIDDGLRDWLDPLVRSSAWMSRGPIPEPAEHGGSGDLDRLGRWPDDLGRVKGQER